MPRKVNFAAIDIGSNAVRLLIKRIQRNEDGTTDFTKEQFVRVPLRLGFDVFDKGEVSPAKTEKFIRLMKAYRNLMRIYDVKAYRACATSAMRDASNGREILRTVASTARLNIEIIAGEEEARIIYNNHIEHVESQSGGNYLYVDVGGGSTEINFITGGKLITSRSYNVGTVRMLEGKVKDSVWERMTHELQAIVEGHPDVRIIGTGGNINKYGKMIGSKNAAGAYIINIDELHSTHAALAALTTEERMHNYGFKPDRADVIVPAGTIYLSVARAVGATQIQVPVIGLADGIIDLLYKDYFDKLAE